MSDASPEAEPEPPDDRVQPSAESPLVDGQGGSRCGCACACHADEQSPIWPGSCAGCCDPELSTYECACTRALAVLPEAPYDRVEVLRNALLGSKDDVEFAVAGQRAYQPAAVSQWTGIKVGGKDYNATVGLEARSLADTDAREYKFVVVIYTGRKMPLYVRAESLSSLEEALTDASRLLLDVEAQEAADGR